MTPKFLKGKAAPKAKPKAKAAPKTGAKAAVKAKPKAAPKAKAEKRRWICRMCNYIYSEQLGEPHNGIKPGTAFEHLPDTYVCPVCGYTGKGRVGKWGFDEWVPTRYVCKICGYIYDKARGEPHRGIKEGTAFEDLPESYACPICAIDTKINREHGRVGKVSFEPLLL
jgi:rubredoxin